MLVLPSSPDKPKVKALALVNVVSAAVNVSTAIDPPVKFWVTVAGPLKFPAISRLPATLFMFSEGLAWVNVISKNAPLSMTVIVSPMNLLER